MYYEPQRDVENKISSQVYKNSFTPLHYHRSIELVYVLWGRIKVRSGNRNFEVKKDQIAFISSCHPHSIDSLEPTKQITFMIPPCYYREFTDKDINLNFSCLCDTATNKTLLFYINEASLWQNQQSEILLKSLINLILAYICKNYTAEEYGSRQNDFVVGVIDYINRNYREKITLDTLADHFGYSRYHFSRLFNRTFNCNLNTYLNNLRSGIAREMLSGGGKKTDILLDSGFNTPSAFYRHNAQAHKGKAGQPQRPNHT